jgi:hypothetical protein
MKHSLPRLLSLLVFAAALLSGCASGYVLDNRVVSFSGLTGVPALPTYRFERLPSQETPFHAQLEEVADVALHNAGLRKTDDDPRYAIQIMARQQRVLSPWATPWHGRRWPTWGWQRPYHSIGFPPFGDPWYQREVGLIVRDLPANRIVYESHAFNEGAWLIEGKAVLPAMFQAALQGFPNPPAGPRRVDIQLTK